MRSTVITSTIENDLCIGCGMCAALCPKGSLEMKWNRFGEYTPTEITPCEKECGMCLKVCPFIDNDDNEDTIGKRLYGPIPGMKHRIETGYYLSAYVGYADEEHRSKGASGGMATWLLEELLEKKIVDHVICVAPNNDSEKLFSFKIFNSPEDVRSCAGSAYYPVEMSEVVKQILETQGKYAIIGHPCFIKAIRLAQARNKKLDERIVVTLGLVCGQLKNKYFTDYIAKLAGVNGKVAEVRYRGKSLGNLTSNYYYSFINYDRDEKRIFWNDGISEAWVNRWFTPKACNYCDDIFAECADLTCMDAWLPEYSQDIRGTSMILVRSPMIAQMIDDGISSHKVFLDAIPIEKVLQSQEGVAAIKRQHLAYRLYLDLQSGFKAPQKRVVSTRMKNPFLRREIVLKELMRKLSRDHWSLEEPNLEQFINVMQPYLNQINRGKGILKFIVLPLQIIRQKIQGSRYG